MAPIKSGMKAVCLLLVALALAGCGGTRLGAGLPRDAAAYSAMPAAAPDRPARDYRIGSLDTLDITVFQEPDLSAKALPVDAAGNVVLPLIGSFPAAGKTATILGREIAQKLGEKYLEKPQVSVVVAGSVSQKVVVQGEVVEPGVYDIKGSTTLLEAVSMAKGETRTASLRRVAVFRTIDGQRTGALFDISSIRNGAAKDPEILGNDVVIVGFSNAKSIWRDVLSTAPLLNIFRPLGY